MIRLRSSIVAVLCVLTVPGAAQAQAAAQPGTPTQVFTLEEALQYAVDHYPTVKAAVEQVNASAAGVSVARAGYLPRLDSLWQSNRATANNIFGQLLPQSVIPAITGPVLSSASSQSVWSSATGALFSWEPFDFGLRDATVRGAEAAVVRARADEALTRLDVQSAVGAAFLGVVAAEQGVVAAEADVDRRDTLARAVHTLADNQLRPGAEASRADAELAAAHTRSIQARHSLLLARMTLARSLGVTTGVVSVNSASLLAAVPAASVPSAAAPAHPLAQARQAAVDVARTQEDVAWPDRPSAALPPIQRVRARERRECRWRARWWRRRFRPRPRELGRGYAGGFPESVRFREPARAPSRLRRVNSGRARTVRRGAAHCDQPAAGGDGPGGGGSRHCCEHAGAIGGRPTERRPGTRAL